MKIDSIYIESFGKFKNYKLDFKDGMNIIYGDNEAGKSTIMAFIEMMFYGRTAQEKSTDVGKSLRKKYAPWDGSAMCGELEFSYGGRSYRIRKVFKKTIKTDIVRLYDAQTGEELELGRDEEIGHRFFGIDVGSFEKSVYISGFGGFASSGQTNEDIAVRLSNLVTTMDEEVSQSTVLARLSRAKELLLSKSGSRGRLVQLTQELEDVQTELIKNEELVRQQSQYIDRRTRLEAELGECIRRKNSLKREEQILKLTETQKQYGKQRTECENEREKITGLIAEGRALEQEKDSFAGKNYNYNTVPEYMQHAGELRHNLSAKQSQADELGKRKQSGVMVDRDDVMLARTQEAMREKLCYLSERISDGYRPALAAKQTAQREETDALSMIDSIGDVKKTRLTASAVALLVTIIFVVMTFTVSVFCLAGAFVSAGVGFMIFSAYKKQYDTHARSMEEAKALIKRRSQEKADASNNLEREKGRLFDKGEGIYPDTECDFETITREKLSKCRNTIDDIYQKYGVSSLSELELLAQENEEAAVNKSLYDAAVAELSEAQSEYRAFVGDDDPERVRVIYNGLREKIAVFDGKLKARNGQIQSYRELDKIVKDIDEQLKENTEKAEELEAELRKLADEADSDILRLDEQSVRNAVDDNEAVMEDIRGQLGELALLLRSPEHDENELKRLSAELTDEYSQKKELYDALELAEENMQAAVDDISRSFGPLLNEKTAEIFSNLTGGRYEKVMVDKEYAIQAKPKAGGYHEWKYLSSGTTDQAYLSLRLAMTELITDNGERLPLMLDDVLLQYDAERAENALEYLKKYAQNAQILFFTCRNMQDEDIINLRNIIE